MLFIHIPKTAGTSFRKSAESFFKKQYISYDYSINSSETSSLIRESIYKRNDIYELSKKIKDFDIKFLSGHIPASKYIHIFGAKNTVTFLRDPVQRLISEYYHFVRHNNYTGDIKSFYRKPQFINRQKKMLQGVPITALGYLGLTEYYSESLIGINNHFNIELPNLELNMGRENKSSNYNLDSETLNEISELNRDDIELYKRASALFTKRKEIEKQGNHYVHGDIQQVTESLISGWAYSYSNDSPIIIKILKNGKEIGEAVATNLMPSLLKLNPPRNGYIGFHFNLKNTCSPGDKITCVASESNQVLGSRLVKKAI